MNEQLDGILEHLVARTKAEVRHADKNYQLNINVAKAKLQRLIVEARIDELKHTSVHESDGIIGVYSSKDNQYVERRERIAQLTTNPKGEE